MYVANRRQENGRYGRYSIYLDIHLFIPGARVTLFIMFRGG